MVTIQKCLKLFLPIFMYYLKVLIREEKKALKLFFYGTDL